MPGRRGWGRLYGPPTPMPCPLGRGQAFPSMIVLNWPLPLSRRSGALLVILLRQAVFPVDMIFFQVAVRVDGAE